MIDQQTIRAVAEIAVPAAAAIIMFCLGLELEGAHFVRALRRPLVLAIALACQLLVPPIIALVLIRLLKLDSILATGLVLVAACPVATPSNLFTRLSRANVALSISLTALTSLAAAIVVPAALWAAQSSVSMGDRVQYSLWKMALGLALMAAGPVAAGMLVRLFRPVLARKMEQQALRLAVVAFVLGVAIAIAGVWSQIAFSFARTGLATLLLNVCAVAASYAIARLGGLADQDRMAVVLGAGTRRFTMASFVAVTLCHDARMLLPAVAYGLIMWGSAGMLVALARTTDRNRRPFPARQTPLPT